MKPTEVLKLLGEWSPQIGGLEPPKGLEDLSVHGGGWKAGKFGRANPPHGVLSRRLSSKATEKRMDLKAPVQDRVSNHRQSGQYFERPLLHQLAEIPLRHRYFPKPLQKTFVGSSNQQKFVFIPDDRRRHDDVTVHRFPLSFRDRFGTAFLPGETVSGDGA